MMQKTDFTFEVLIHDDVSYNKTDISERESILKSW
jgi:hypothetical protein